MLLQVLRAATLDAGAYRGIRKDPSAVWTSAGVVVSVAIAFGLGFWNEPVQELGRPFAMILRIGVVFNGWLLWSALALVIGRLFFRGQASFTQILKGIGLAFTPGLLLVLFPIPVVGETLSILGRVWILATATMATRETMKVKWPGAVTITVVGWLVAFVLLPTMFLQGPLEPDVPEDTGVPPGIEAPVDPDAPADPETPVDPETPADP